MLPSPPFQDWQEESEDRTLARALGRFKWARCSVVSIMEKYHNTARVGSPELPVRLYTFSPVRHPRALDTGEVDNGGGGRGRVRMILSQGLTSMQEGISTHRLQRGKRHV